MGYMQAACKTNNWILHTLGTILQNIDFDDDEDDFNMDDDNNDGIHTFSLLTLVICAGILKLKVVNANCWVNNADEGTY